MQLTDSKTGSASVLKGDFQSDLEPEPRRARQFGTASNNKKSSSKNAGLIEVDPLSQQKQYISL